MTMTPSDHRILLCMIHQSEVLSRVSIVEVTRGIGYCMIQMGVRMSVGVLFALHLRLKSVPGKGKI